VVEGLFRSVRDGERQAVLSVVTEIELLVKPMREGKRQEIARIGILLDAEGVNVMDLDRHRVAQVAAELRARQRLSLADAVIVATGIVTGCDAVVGNDERCARRVTEIPYIYLEEMARPS
jgi:predicted nucleic acid-binding protein